MLILAFLMKRYKLSILIAGYNTSSKKEKDKYDEKKLVSVVSCLLTTLATPLVLGALIAYFFKNFQETIILVSWIVFVAIILVGLIYINVTKYVKK